MFYESAGSDDEVSKGRYILTQEREKIWYMACVACWGSKRRVKGEKGMLEDGERKGVFICILDSTEALELKHLSDGEKDVGTL